MISRYTLPEMGSVWTDEHKFEIWLKVELAVCRARAKIGQIPDEVVKEIEEKAEFNPDRIREIEKETRHDVIAFLTSVAEYVGPQSKHIHFGMTSSDLVDTSLSILMVEALNIIQLDLEKLFKTVKSKALEFKNIIMPGRTHGIHAEPITLGHKLAIWAFELKRHLTRLKNIKDTISYGKISGAVGTYANLEPKIEELVCQELGLKPAEASNQVLQRDRHAEYLTVLALVASSLEKFAVEIRGLQRTDLAEAEEPFKKGQKGSSAMPHKRNPILSERITGLARIIKTNALAALDNVALWHERDITHSSVERVIIPDSTILLDYILQKFNYIINGLVVYPERMLENLDKTKGLVNSQRVLLALVEKGLLREEAYRLVQKNAMEAIESGKSFFEVLESDNEVSKYLNPKELSELNDYKYFLRHTEVIFNRLKGIDI